MLDPYFSTRETAVMIIAAIIFIFGLGINIRNKVSLWQLFKPFLAHKGMIPIVGYLLYIGIVFYVGYVIHLWGTNLLGTLFLWTITAGIVLLFSILDAGKRNIFKDAALSVLAFNAIFGYLRGINTFPLWVELIWGIVYLFLIIFVLVLRNQKADPPRLERLVVLLIFAVLLFQFSYSINVFNADPSKDIEIVIGKFMLPIIMTFASLLFIFPLAIYSSYEDLFAHIRAVSPPGTDHRPVKRAIIVICGLSLKKIYKFRLNVLIIREIRGKSYKEAIDTLRTLESSFREE